MFRRIWNDSRGMISKSNNDASFHAYRLLLDVPTLIETWHSVTQKDPSRSHSHHPCASHFLCGNLEGGKRYSWKNQWNALSWGMVSAVVATWESFTSTTSWNSNLLLAVGIGKTSLVSAYRCGTCSEVTEGEKESKCKYYMELCICNLV